MPMPQSSNLKVWRLTVHTLVLRERPNDVFCCWREIGTLFSATRSTYTYGNGCRKFCKSALSGASSPAQFPPAFDEILHPRVDGRVAFVELEGAKVHL